MANRYCLPSIGRSQTDESARDEPGTRPRRISRRPRRRRVRSRRVPATGRRIPRGRVPWPRARIRTVLERRKQSIPVISATTSRDRAQTCLTCLTGKKELGLLYWLFLYDRTRTHGALKKIGTKIRCGDAKMEFLFCFVFTFVVFF